MDGRRSTSPSPSLIWEKALERHNTLAIKDGAPAVGIDGVEAPEELLRQVESLAPPRVAGLMMSAWRRLQAILLGLVDFMAVLTWILFVNGSIAATVPGLLWLAIMVCSPPREFDKV